jgi:prepilin-type N-terminal cleavage/methylation domain-containing protein
MNKEIFKIKYKNQLQRGFTLIELLVVIGILGVLAAALIATIDPFEQIKKAQDSSEQSIAKESLGAIQRYYANHTALPWWTVANGGTNCYASSNQLSAVTLTNLNTGSPSCLGTIITDGELKSSFTNTSATYLSGIYVTNPNAAPDATTMVCFLPASKAFKTNPNTKYTQTGTINASCPSAAVACYQCLQ